MKKTGQLLREARENSGISLQEVSVHLKISIRVLKALEEGDLNNLPSKTFLRGFVQSYSQFMRMDGAKVLETFQEEMGTTHPKMITKNLDVVAPTPKQYLTPSEVSVGAQLQGGRPQEGQPLGNQSQGSQVSLGGPEAPVVETKKEETLLAPVAPSLSVDQKTWSHSMKIITVVIILGIAGIIYGVLKTIEKYEREAQVVSDIPAELQAVPRTDGEPAPSLLPAEIGEGVIVAPTPTATPDQAVAAMATNTPEVSQTNPAPKATATPESPAGTLAPTGVPVVAAPTNVPPVEAGATTPNTKRPHEVIVEALDKVIVDYSIDGKPSATMTLTAEKVHTFRADTRVSLGFSDGGSVNLIYNGKDKGVPGNLGKPLKVSFPQ